MCKNRASKTSVGRKVEEHKTKRTSGTWSRPDDALFSPVIAQQHACTPGAGQNEVERGSRGVDAATAAATDQLRRFIPHTRHSSGAPHPIGTGTWPKPRRGSDFLVVVQNKQDLERKRMRPTSGSVRNRYMRYAGIYLPDLDLAREPPRNPYPTVLPTQISWSPLSASRAFPTKIFHGKRQSRAPARRLHRLTGKAFTLSGGQGS